MARIFGEMPFSLNFPRKPPNLSNESQSEVIYFELSNQETLQLNHFARKNQTTLFIIFSALYGVILSKYSNQKKLLIRYPIDMRPRGYSQVTGCFVNNVPLKIDLDSNTTLYDLIKDLTIQRKYVYEGTSGIQLQIL